MATQTLTQEFMSFITHFSFYNYTIALIILVMGFILAKVVSSLMKKLTKKRASSPQLLLLRRFLFYGILFIFILMALQQVGFDLSILLGALGIFSIALGFASKTTVSNLISGLFLVFDKSFKIGDTIKVDNIVGKVLSVDTLSIKLASFDNQYIRVPNETLIKTNIYNLSYFPTRRVDIPVGIAYEADIDKAKEVLIKTAKDNQFILQAPEPFVNFQTFADSSINIQLSAWAKSENFMALKNSLSTEIKMALEKHNINIPFPCMSLYADNALPLQLEKN